MFHMKQKGIPAEIKQQCKPQQKSGHSLQIFQEKEKRDFS